MNLFDILYGFGLAMIFFAKESLTWWGIGILALGLILGWWWEWRTSQ